MSRTWKQWSYGKYGPESINQRNRLYGLYDVRKKIVQFVKKPNFVPKKEWKEEIEELLAGEKIPYTWTPEGYVVSFVFSDKYIPSLQPKEIHEFLLTNDGTLKRKDGRYRYNLADKVVLEFYWVAYSVYETRHSNQLPPWICHGVSKDRWFGCSDYKDVRRGKQKVLPVYHYDNYDFNMWLEDDN